MTENSSEEIKSLLQRTFMDRKYRSMTQDISEEILECPPLLQAEYVSARRSSKLKQRTHAINTRTLINSNDFVYESLGYSDGLCLIEKECFQ